MDEPEYAVEEEVQGDWVVTSLRGRLNAMTAPNHEDNALTESFDRQPVLLHDEVGVKRVKLMLKGLAAPGSTALQWFAL